MDQEIIRSAAVDGKDWPMVALCVLAHPYSQELPRLFVERLSGVAFGDGEVTDFEAVVALAGSHWLDEMIAKVDACQTA
jgi:hypothetical protein